MDKFYNGQKIICTNEFAHLWQACLEGSDSESRHEIGNSCEEAIQRLIEELEADQYECNLERAKEGLPPILVQQ
jgi:hypothetical protein